MMITFTPMSTMGGNKGNYYYGARYYDPKISVWLSVDPLAHEFPWQSPYVFTDNNPINLVDPDGRAAIPFEDDEGDPTKPPNNGDQGPEQRPPGANPNIPFPIDEGSTSGGGGGSSNNSPQTIECNDCPEYIGGSGMLEWVSTGGLNVVKAFKGLYGAYKGYQAAKTLKGVVGLLKPAGKLIGKQEARNPKIRTLSPENAKDLISALQKMGAKEVAKKGYPGTWYELPNGIGGFGVRHSVSGASKAKGSSSAIDLDIVGFSLIKNIKF